MEKIKDLYYSSSRLESLSDGIFAFAMTLLVLNLNAPELHGAVTNQELVQNLLALSNRFFSFLLSFFLLASAWGVHHRQFSFIKQSDSNLTWINMLRLLFVVIVPFSSVLVGSYPDLGVASFFFSVNIFFLCLMSFLEWKYAASHGFVEGLSDEHFRSANIKNAFPIAVAAISCMIAFFSPTASQLVYLILPFGFIFLKKTGRTT